MLDKLIHDLEKGTADIITADLSSFPCKPKTSGAIESLKANNIVTLQLCTDLDLHDILHLSQALAINTSLETLDLSGNNFASNSCLALGRALEHNNTLRKLTLYNNDIIGTLAIEQFIRGAQKNTGLRALRLLGDGICNSACIQKIIELMPRLHTLYSNIFSSGMAFRIDPKEVMYFAGQNGLFKALKNHYSLCFILLGGNCLESGSLVIDAVARRNRSVLDTIYQLAPEIFRIGIHEKGISQTTLKAVYDLPQHALAIRDFVLYYKGSAYYLETQLHEREMSGSDANKLLKEVRDLGLCIYARDVVCKDTPEADKFSRFCSVMAMHNREKTRGVRITNLERAAKEYYKSADDPFAAEIDQAITQTNASLDAWYQRRVEETRAVQAVRDVLGNFENFYIAF